jgi:hypothetical protein
MWHHVICYTGDEIFEEAATLKMEAAGSCETLVPIKLYDIIAHKTIILILSHNNGKTPKFWINLSYNMQI